MSAIKKPSGAKNRKSKRNQLIKEIASRPGQLKISNIFMKSIETVCEKKSSDSACSLDGQSFAEKVQGHESDISNIPNVSSMNNLRDDSNAGDYEDYTEKMLVEEVVTVDNTIGPTDIPSHSNAGDYEDYTEKMLVEEVVTVDNTIGPTDIPSHSNAGDYEDYTEKMLVEEVVTVDNTIGPTDIPTHSDVAELEKIDHERNIDPLTEPRAERAQSSSQNDAEVAILNDRACVAAGQKMFFDLTADKENTLPSNSSPMANLTKLSIEWFLRNYDCLRLTKVRENGKLRPFLQCNVCKKFEKVARNTSKNGSVRMADGIRVDSQEKLQRVLDHLNGRCHKDAILTMQNHELWINRSEDHIWRKYLQIQHRDLVELLIRLALDVYNDSLHDTLPAWNWAARSLTQHKSDQLVKCMNGKGFDSALPSFELSDSLLRYRNPVAYAEMLDIIYQLENEKIGEQVNNSICYSVQVDGSIDRTRRDNKYVCVKSIEADSSTKSFFVSVVNPQENGAKGLLEAVFTALNQTHITRKKLFSVTTDGESACTGRHAGLWALLEKEVKHKLLTIWCSCHRSDLAFEDLEKLIPELKDWRKNLLACSNFFRSSKCLTKSLEEFGEKIGVKILKFPKHFEVRFAEHLNAILNAIIRNLPACKKVWMSIVQSKVHSAADRAEASQFLNDWRSDSLNYILTGLMCDITSIFTSLQKGLQKPYLILPDVLTLRDAAVRKLDVMADMATPGGEEEKCLQSERQKDNTIRSHFQLQCNENEEVNENYGQLRKTIISTTRELLSRRLNVENDEDKSIETIRKVVTATSCNELVKASVAALKLFLYADLPNQENDEKIQELVQDVCDSWEALSIIPNVDTFDVGCKYSLRLRKMFVKSKGRFQWLLGVFLVAAPHNMGTERVVSHSNQIKSIHRENTSEETLSKRLTIAMNGVGTAHYDPRPAVIRFLEAKDRRFRSSDFEVYQNRDFVKKFFRTDSVI